MRQDCKSCAHIPTAEEVSGLCKEKVENKGHNVWSDMEMY